MNPNYEEYRHNKIESGLLFQDFVVDVLYQLGLVVVQYTSKFYQLKVGETRNGFEIKHDEKYARTGNLWIEVAEKARPRSGDFAPSGICRGDNSWLYVIGDYDTIFVFSKVLLLALKESGRYPLVENHTRTSIGFLLRQDHAHRYAAIVVKPNASVKVVKQVKDLESLGRELHRAVLADPAQRSFVFKQHGED